MSSEEDNWATEDSYFSDDYYESEEIQENCIIKQGTCLTLEEVDRFLFKEAQNLQDSLNISNIDEARMLLHRFHWDANEVVRQFNENSADTALKAGISLSTPASEPLTDECMICLELTSNYRVSLYSLACGLTACKTCWLDHVREEINRGRSTQISCMELDCPLLVPHSFVLEIISQRSETLKDRYIRSCRNDWIWSHPKLRPCPGVDCSVVFKIDQGPIGGSTCSECHTQVCLDCGDNYHAPTDCDTIKKWLLKCQTDIRTATFISNNTKDCPNCGVPIIKDGGCHWMKCQNCQFEFCWLCRSSIAHTEVYSHECNKFEGNIHDGKSLEMAKYHFYANRWESHAEALRLEKENHENIRRKINEKIARGEGNWIEWQYLFEAVEVLEKARYTLQYTYPYAYFHPENNRKELFEFRQANMERSIETLSHQLERAHLNEREAISRQIYVVNSQRTSLLEGFQSSPS